MKTPLLFVTLLLLATSAGAQLEFEGAFWNSKDYYFLSFDFEGEHPQAKWEGSSVQPGHLSRPDAERVEVTFDLQAKEIDLLREFSSYFALCHSGYRMLLGTGLLVRATLNRPDAEPLQHAYFGTSRQNRNGLRTRRLPELFYSIAIDGDFSATDRKRFFNEISSFNSDLKSHRMALGLLEKAYGEGRNPDWDQIKKLAAEPLFKSEEERDLSVQFTEEASLVIDALFEKGSTLKPHINPGQKKIVLLSGLSSTSETSYHYSLPLPSRSLDRENWAFLPPGLIPLFADFVSAPDYLSLRQCDMHSYLSIPVPMVIGPNSEENPEWEKRIEYLKQAGIETSMFSSDESFKDVQQVKIHSLEFSENTSKCVVVSHHDGEALFTLLYVEDAEWKTLRTIDSNDWKEYGWKEPLFK